MQRIHVLKAAIQFTVRRKYAVHKSRARTATRFPRSRHANHTCLSANRVSFVDVVQCNNSAVASGCKLRPNRCYHSRAAHGWYTNNPPIIRWIPGGAPCHIFTCTKARLSTRVCLVNCSYPRAAGMMDTAIQWYICQGSVSRHVGHLATKDTRRSAGLDQ
jgi:hypothetical protein